MIDNQLVLRRFIDTEAVLADAGGKRGDQKCGRSSTQLGYSEGRGWTSSSRGSFWPVELRCMQGTMGIKKLIARRE